jgi:hypothetical protein
MNDNEPINSGRQLRRTLWHKGKLVGAQAAATVKSRLVHRCRN